MDAASIEQMNKVRVSLGMAPLPVPGAASGPEFKSANEDDSSGSESDELSTLDKREAAADSNWQKLEDEKRDKADRLKRKDAAKKARDAAQRFAKLEGKGLGDVDEKEELDTRTWLLQQKKRQKRIEKARKLEQELAARELQQADYSAKDLAGVKVGHEADQFDEITGEQILTLKDAEIGDESEDDELENADMKAQEKLEERLRLKKKRPDYDPMDDNEGKNVLSKYDEEIDGKKGKAFTLDGRGSTVQKQPAAESGLKSKAVKISLDILKDDVPASDYVDISTMKVRKPKKSKKEKKVRQKAADEDDIFPRAESAQVPAAEPDSMEIDNLPTIPAPSKKRAFDFDDDDLQAKLAESRRQALKKRKKMDGAELARQMREEMPIDEEVDEDGGMTLDETSEFVANLKKPEAPELRESKPQALQSARTASPDEADGDGDTTMATESYAEVAERSEVKREASSAPPTDSNITTTGLEDEDTLAGQGLGASLSMLRKRGLITDPAAANLQEKESQRSKFLASKQSLIDSYDARARSQREADRKSGRLDNLSTTARDTYARQQNEERERYIARLLAEMFRDEYRPDVKLAYHDEFGRSLGQKEAFKHLSHMFHGKGSGKGKTEKRLKRIEGEKAEEGKGVLNAGGEGGFMNVQGREGRKQRQAGVRLQ